MRRLLTTFTLAVVATLPLGPLPRLEAQPAGALGIVWSDVTSASGITFRHTSGAFGKKYLPETMGSGVVFFDFDGDGAQDVFFVNSTRFAGRPERPGLPALYRNDGKGRFTDVTKAAGLAVEMYGLGAAAADYDNDGHVDLYVTCLGPNRLFRNLGRGTFADVTAKAGVGDPGFSTSAMFFDYDKDGRLDLVVANYVTWSIEMDLFCTLDGNSKSYCTPESYKGQSLRLYRGLVGGVFEDATKKAGLEDARAKSLGLALIDFDSDAWPDLFVANDTQPNKLYKNNANGSFSDVGMAAGVAFGETGVARAGMGTDAADYSGSGRPSLLIGNFSNEMLGLYHNEGNGLFIDEAPSSTVGQASLLTLTFAAFFFDFDLDGKLDIFSVGGHPAFDRKHGSVTAGNASPLTDGASALVLINGEKALAEGRIPLRWVRSWAWAALDPAAQLLQGPAYAAPRALDRAGLSMKDIGLMEMHEAFSAQVLSNLQALSSADFARRELGRGEAVGHPDPECINVMGGSIAIGHPFGATGGRLTLTLLNEMARRDVQFGLLTLCAAGGMGFAMVLERR